MFSVFCYCQCIETLGNGCLSEPHMAELLKILDKQLKEHFEREVERLEKRKDEDYDEVSSIIPHYYTCSLWNNALFVLH